MHLLDRPRKQIRHIAICAAILTCWQQAHCQNQAKETEGAQVYFSSELVFALHLEHNHAPSIVELPLENSDDANHASELLVSWYRGSGERKADDVAVYGAHRNSEGQWTTPFLLADHPEFPDCNTAMMVDPQGRLWLFWPTILANTWESCITQFKVAERMSVEGKPEWNDSGVILLKPADFSETAMQLLDKLEQSMSPDARQSYANELATVRRRLTDKLFQRLGWQPRCKPTILPSGRILLPLYTDTFSISIMAISDDQGMNWTASGPLLGFGNIQPSVLRRNDGTLVALMRNNGPSGKMLVSESRDDGTTWSIAVDGNLNNPGSGLDAIRLRNGHWLIAYNDTLDGRNRLAVSVSYDEGKTWAETRYLENEISGSYHYPAVIQSRDNRIHVVYSYFVDGGKSMKHATFSESWVRAAD